MPRSNSRMACGKMKPITDLSKMYLRAKVARHPTLRMTGCASSSQGRQQTDDRYLHKASLIVSRPNWMLDIGIRIPEAMVYFFSFFGNLLISELYENESRSDFTPEGN